MVAGCSLFGWVAVMMLAAADKAGQLVAVEHAMVCDPVQLTLKSRQVAMSPSLRAVATALDRAILRSSTGATASQPKPRGNILDHHRFGYRRR